MSDHRVNVLAPSDGEHLNRSWGYPFVIKVDAANGGAKQIVAGTERLPPGRCIHVHKHDDSEELLIIVSGHGTAHSEAGSVPVGAGHMIFIQQHAWHGLENTGEGDLDLIWIFPKPGMERYFRQTSIQASETTGTGSHGTIRQNGLSRDELDEIRLRHAHVVAYRDALLVDYTRP